MKIMPCRTTEGYVREAIHSVLTVFCSCIVINEVSFGRCSALSAQAFRKHANAHHNSEKVAYIGCC